ncbi:GNAT family N-acetyltransferase [Paenibacillus eucommiae]|uniref:GNAT family N-acetyltransferase n=1 Tax=Paenibacillus eucommiae TaxID=1355755 RepID=A0ABS4JBQ1_9BACL|nr:GNAT family N-acetyltransferase [Paenibacillus eucommiae]MBP1996521.1 hypothetical protein [Paenibacillus eucommiae]
MDSNNMVHTLELTSESFNKATGLFEALKHHISIQGVVTGSIAGRIFLSKDCSSALLTNPQGIFIGGSPENHLFFVEANTLLKEELLPCRASAGKLDYVLFYPTDNYWEEAIGEVMKDLLPMKSGRMTFSHDLDHVQSSFYDGVFPVTGSLLKQQDLTGLDGVVSEIQEGWPSIEAFEDNGFGCVAIQDTKEGSTIISWCLTDWVVGNECEFGIETVESFRGNGWARKTASGALLLAKQRGLKRVGWQCWSNNIGSQKTALSAGFELLADFPVMFGWNRPLNNLLVNGNHYMRGNSKYGVEKNYARAAWSYAQALDKGSDWNGDAALYWNASCMFYLTGETERAKHYYNTAVEKGWKDIYQPHYHEHVYREQDSEQIARILAEPSET